MNETRCDQVGLAVDWVLGTMSPGDAERYAEHLETCTVCLAEVARLDEASDSLADAAPPARPPPELRARLMAAVDAETRLFRAAQEADTAPEAVARQRPVRTALLAGLTAVCLVGVGVVIGSELTSSDRGADLRRVEGSVTKAGGGSSARAVVEIRGPMARLILTNVAAPPKGRVYQAWVVRHRSTTSTGMLFSVPRSGDAKVSLPSLRGVTRIIVSSEPPRGSRSPTPPVVVTVPLAR